MTVIAEACASLALTKYWGKVPEGTNVPATSSLAVTLDALRTQTKITPRTVKSDPLATEDRRDAFEDSVAIDDANQDIGPFRPVIDAVREHSDSPCAVAVASHNSFPTAAGLASSSSGFAALAVGLNAFFGTSLSETELSSIARLGSGSAARAVYGGFTIWPAGAEYAVPLAAPNHWPDLRVIAVVIRSGPKGTSSRSAMENSRMTSPFYESWTSTSESLFTSACEAVRNRDLEKLGTTMRQSYLRMFSTMFTSEPPLIYWQPESLALIRHCEDLRARGLPVWETMDAGPQVKLVTEAASQAAVAAGIREILPEATLITSAVGAGPTSRTAAEE